MRHICQVLQLVNFVTSRQLGVTRTLLQQQTQRSRQRECRVMPAHDYLSRRERSRWWPILFTLLLPLPAALWLLGPSAYKVEVTGLAWITEIEIERLMDEPGSDWCDTLPADAQITQRRQVDAASAPRQGVEHCRYVQRRWRKLRNAWREGRAPEPPQWPALELSDRPADELGAERAGKRRAIYELLLRDADGRDWRCERPYEDWLRWRVGTRLRLSVDRFGTANCDSLPRQAP